MDTPFKIVASFMSIDPSYSCFDKDPSSFDVAGGMVCKEGTDSKIDRLMSPVRGARSWLWALYRGT